MQLRRHLRLFTIFSQTAYPSPLKAARPSSDSLRSPTPGRLASRRSLLGNFLPALTSLTLVNRSLLAALTALYLLRESFKLLIFLKFLIVCHALPHAYGFAAIPTGWTTPALPHASSLQPTSLLGRLKGVDTPACAHFAYAREPLLSSRR